MNDTQSTFLYPVPVTRARTKKLCRIHEPPTHTRGTILLCTRDSRADLRAARAAQQQPLCFARPSLLRPPHSLPTRRSFASRRGLAISATAGAAGRRPPRRRSRDDLAATASSCGCLPSTAASASAKALDAARHAVGGAPTGIGQPPTVRPQGYARQGCARALAAKRSHLSLGCLRRASCRTRPGRCQFCPRDWVVPKLPPAHAPTRGRLTQRGESAQAPSQF